MASSTPRAIGPDCSICSQCPEQEARALRLGAFIARSKLEGAALADQAEIKFATAVSGQNASVDEDQGSWAPVSTRAKKGVKPPLGVGALVCHATLATRLSTS